MTTDKQTRIEKDVPNKKIKVVRAFDAPRNEVWKAWTDSAVLDQWWAPKPYKAETKTMDFREGGTWLYCMVGPEGDKQWCRADYTVVDAPNRYSGTDGFCDEAGNINNEMPVMHWDVRFAPENNHTVVTIELTFDSAEDLNKIVEMGFEEGFTAAHGNLDELLAKK